MSAFRASGAMRYVFRGNITSKRGNNRFYKGRGAPSMGHIAKGTDQYIVDDKKWARNTFVVPSLTSFKLKPYIAPQTEKAKIPAPRLYEQVNSRKVYREDFRVRQERILKITELLDLQKEEATKTLPQLEVTKLENERATLESILYFRRTQWSASERRRRHAAKCRWTRTQAIAKRMDELKTELEAFTAQRQAGEVSGPLPRHLLRYRAAMARKEAIHQRADAKAAKAQRRVELKAQKAALASQNAV